MKFFTTSHPPGSHAIGIAAFNAELMLRLTPTWLRRWRTLVVSVGLFLGLGADSILSAEPIFNDSSLWQKQEDGVPSYFVYGLTCTTKGTLLAFAEARFGADEAPHHLALKRSTDGGVTWSKNNFIEKADGGYWQANGNPGKKECWANPAAVTDRTSGRTFIFYALNEGEIDGKNMQRYTRNFFRYSDDDGVTWSDRVDISRMLNVREDGSPNDDAHGRPIVDANGFPCDYLGRAFHMPGPGHGLQLKSGRLLMPFWNRVALGTKEKPVPTKARQYGICLLISDDGGKTWRNGPQFARETGCTESRLVELDNGEIYLNARAEYSQQRSQRDIYRGTNGGLTWERVGYDASMPLYFRVDSGLAELHEDGKQILLSSHCRSSTERKELTVSLSTDGGKTWALHKVLNLESASYSDLVVMPGNMIGLLYGKSGSPDATRFARFNLAWLRLPPGIDE